MPLDRLRQSFRSLSRRSRRTPVLPPIPKNPWRILITGGAGHLAQTLVKTIEDQFKTKIRSQLTEYYTARFEMENHDTVGSIRRRRMDNLELEIERETQNLLKTRVQFVLIDILKMDFEFPDHITFIESGFNDEAIMKTALKMIDTVYHLAAVGMTGKWAKNRHLCLNTNSTDTTNLLTWSRLAGVQRFIYASSVGVVFQGQPLIDAGERLTPYPTEFYNFYCESKAQAEKIVINGSGHHMKTAILRFSGIYGPGEKRVTERVVKFMKTGWWIGIAKDNGVEALTQLSSVSNCVQGLVKVEESLRYPDHCGGRVYHIVDREKIGTFSHWAPINRALGFSEPFIIVPSCVLRALAKVCEGVADYFKWDPFVSIFEVDLLTITNTYSIARAEREFGYRPEPSPIPQIIDMYCKDIVNTPAWQRQIKRVHYQQFLVFYIILPIAVLLAFWFLYPYSLPIVAIGLIYWYLYHPYILPCVHWVLGLVKKEEATEVVEELEQ